MRRTTALVSLLALAVSAPLCRAASIPDRIAVTPDGATLHPGDTLRLEAVALTRKGHTLRDAIFTWRSSRPSVVSVDGNGFAAAGRIGTAVISASWRGKSGEVTVSVVERDTGSGGVVQGGLGAVSGLVVDDASIYWTEADAARVRVRTSAKGGGAVHELLSEPRIDAGGRPIRYLHLRQTAEYLVWSRVSSGAVERFSLITLPKVGGDPRVLLPEDAGGTPPRATAWTTAGESVAAVVADDPRLGLPDDTRIATADPGVGLWSPLLGSSAAPETVDLLAGDARHLALRFRTDAGTAIAQIPLVGADRDLRVLARSRGREADFGIPGAIDGRRVYFWSAHDLDQRLLSVPLDGGGVKRLLRGRFGPGLTEDGGQLYWLAPRAGGVAAVVRVRTSGGNVHALRGGLLPFEGMTGLALDATGLYFLRAGESGAAEIVRVAR